MAQGKGVSPVGIDMDMSQLLVYRCPLKNKKLSKRFLYFRPKLTANQGLSTGIVFDPILDQIGNV